MVQTTEIEEIEDSLLPPEIITEIGPEYSDTKRQFQGIPTIERAPSGKLWAAWYSGGVWESWENYILMASSLDNGITWSAPTLMIRPKGHIRGYDPCLWLAPNGRLWCFWAQCYAQILPDGGGSFMDGRMGVWAMSTASPDDDQPEWDTPSRIGDGVMMNKPITTKNGDWVLPVSIWEPTPHRKEHKPPIYHWMEDNHGAYAVLSKDNGQSFEYMGAVNTQENRVFDEHMFVERNDDSLWMLSRVKNGIWENVSGDGGRSWDQGKLSSIPHEDSRFFIRRLQSGNLLLVRHIPNDEKPQNRSHLTAFLSKDDGHTWEGGLLLDERSRVSYPDGCQAPDGCIYIVYDYNRSTDKQILMATFYEEDILAGKLTSPSARARVLINQATGACGTPNR